MSTTAYQTIEQAQQYFDDRLDTESWDEATTINKNKALKTATRLINALEYTGSKTVSSQENKFPRYNDLTVPRDIEIACNELALSLLDGIKPGEEINSLLINSVKMGNVSTNYNRDNLPIFILAGIPNSIAWAHLRPYLRDWNNLELIRG